jgi:cyclase
MIKKRIIAVINIKKNLVVQSFSFQNYLPIGNIKYAIENLNRWNVDEILIQCIDKSILNQGPDFDLIYKLKKNNISTPIIYGGGIRSASDCQELINSGVERILIDRLLHYNLNEVTKISQLLGSQALIASLPIAFQKNQVIWFDYMNKIYKKFSNEIINFINSGIFSEILITDHKNEGIHNSFDKRILKIKIFKNINLILFGGISTKSQIENIIKNKNVSAIAIGNFLHYKELSYQKLKNYVTKNNHSIFRKEFYSANT